MKKLLLLSLISCISFLGFTSANYTFTSNTNDNALYSPNNITLTESFDFYNNVLNYNCENTSCQIIISDNDYNQMCDISYNNSDGIFTEGSIDNCNFSAGNYIVFGTMEDQIFSSITFGVNNEGGAEGGNNGNIIAGGISAFSGTIGRLGKITNEIIPYMIYIFIGYLGIVLMYKAVNMIINYLNGKSKNSINQREIELYQRYRHDKDDYEGKIKNDEYYKNLKYDGKDKKFKKWKKYFGYN